MLETYRLYIHSFDQYDAPEGLNPERRTLMIWVTLVHQSPDTAGGEPETGPTRLRFGWANLAVGANQELKNRAWSGL